MSDSGMPHSLSDRFAFVKVFMVTVLLMAISGQAVSIQPAKIEISYVPGQVTQHSFNIFGAERIRSYLSGELAPYAQIFDPFNDSGSRTISVTLRLPPEGVLDPGRRTLLVGAIELPTFEESQIGAVAAIQAPLYVEVPFPGLYVVMGMELSDGDIESIIPVIVTAYNKGREIATNLRATFELFRNGTDEKILSLASSARSVMPGSAASFRFNVNTSGLSTGAYRAVGRVVYDGGQKESQKILNLGTLGLKIVDFTSRFVSGEINPFIIEIQNTGSIPLQNVFGELSIGGLSVRTPPINLGGWQSANLTSYFDASGIRDGVYSSTATVFFADRSVQAVKEVSFFSGRVEPVAFPISAATGMVIVGLLFITAGLVFLIMRYRYVQTSQN